MSVTIRALKALAALGIAVLLSFGALIVGGVALPVLGLIGIFGSKEMYDAPGHGGGAVIGLTMFTLPVAAVFAIGLAAWLTAKLYSRFTRHSTPQANKNVDVV